MQRKEFNWRTKTGHKIHACCWTPENPKGVICLVHGLGEHIARYQHLAEYFGNQGYAIIANDHFGHGKSEGKRGHMNVFEDFMKEIDRLLEEADARFSGKPRFLYGHSLGGNFVLNYLLRKKPKIAGVIATGPWIKLGFAPPAYLVFLGKITRKLAPSFSQKNALDTSQLSHDLDVVSKYEKDPLVHDQITSAMGMDMLGAASYLLEHAGAVDIPLLLMHGAGDKITSPEGTKEFAAKSSGDVTLQIWEDWYHEIHNEIGKEKLFDYTLKWMEKRMV